MTQHKKNYNRVLTRRRFLFIQSDVHH